ncbi:hypothetical protein ACOSQ4_013187 [Xanthoceras sorbifolium]
MVIISLNQEEVVSLLMACHAKEENHRNMWYLDTSCSNHMCREKSVFSDKGNVSIRTKANYVQIIYNVFFVPYLKTNLLSIIILELLGMLRMPIFRPKEKKIDDKGEKCIFLGVNNQSKAYKLYNPITKKIVISHDVVFDEGKLWSWSDNTIQQQIPAYFDGKDYEKRQQPMGNVHQPIFSQIVPTNVSSPSAAVADVEEEQRPQHVRKRLAWMMDYKWNNLLLGFLFLQRNMCKKF